MEGSVLSFLRADASYQVLVQLAMWFQRRRFLEIHQSETRIACGGMFVNGIATK
jgi:hypothetical protein